MFRKSLPVVREIAQQLIDRHGWVLVCRECSGVCVRAIGESSEFHRWDWSLFLALLSHECPEIDERESRWIAAQAKARGTANASNV